MKISDSQPELNQFQIPMAKYVARKCIFCSMNKAKIRGERIFEIIHFPFDGQAGMHHQIQPERPCSWS